MPSDHSATSRRVWFITGAGRGLGRAFAEAALEAGDQVVATARDPSALAGLTTAHPGDLAVLPVDVRDREAVTAAVAEAIGAFGHLDVVVNNAGYGLVGTAEEVSEAQAREELDTNLLGPLWVVQAALPHLRSRGSGHIVQISTTGAVGSMPAFGLYNASKWGLEGFSEALAAEVAGFGIRVTIAELAGFATDWAGGSLRFAEPEPAYDALREATFGTAVVPWPVEAADDEDRGSGAGEEPEPGDPDPAVAAAALLAHVDAADGPLRLLIGDEAPGQVAAALALRRDDYRRDARFGWPA